MPVRRSGKLTSFICRFCYDLVASTSWSSQGLSGPLIVLLYSTLNKNNRVVCLGPWHLRFVDSKFSFYYRNYWHDLDSCRY